MKDENIYETDRDDEMPDPDEIPIRDRRLYTQQYDLVVESLMKQIREGTIYLRPLSDRPSFQRRYVWPNVLASRLIESILLNVPIPPCYLSQTEEFELDVIDGQQRLFSIYRFLDNQFALTGLEVLTELNGARYHDIPPKLQRQLFTHTLRCVLITNESHPEIKFDVFERLNTNTIPLNPQELRNCIFRGSLNSYLKEAAAYKPWLDILGRNAPDRRMRDEELVLRFLAFNIQGVDTYRTPLKHWLNDAAKAGRKYSKQKISELDATWRGSVDTSLVWFRPAECFRRELNSKKHAINRALFDLVMITASKVGPQKARRVENEFRKGFEKLTHNEEFVDLISRAVDHKKRTLRRFEMWDKVIGRAVD